MSSARMASILSRVHELSNDAKSQQHITKATHLRNPWKVQYGYKGVQSRLTRHTKSAIFIPNNRVLYIIFDVISISCVVVVEGGLPSQSEPVTIFIVFLHFPSQGFGGGHIKYLWA